MHLPLLGEVTALRAFFLFLFFYSNDSNSLGTWSTFGAGMLLSNLGTTSSRSSNLFICGRAAAGGGEDSFAAPAASAAEACANIQFDKHASRWKGGRSETVLAWRALHQRGERHSETVCVRMSPPHCLRRLAATPCVMAAASQRNLARTVLLWLAAC